MKTIVCLSSIFAYKCALCVLTRINIGIGIGYHQVPEELPQLILCVYLFVYLSVLSFRSKFLFTKPLTQQIYYCFCCLFMLWSGIPAAISVDYVTVKEDDWTGISHPNKQQTE